MGLPDVGWTAVHATLALMLQPMPSPPSAQEINVTDEKDRDLEQKGLLMHEVLHMAAFLMKSVDTELLSHPAIKNNPAWLSLCANAHQSLFDLYQAIGAGEGESTE